VTSENKHYNFSLGYLRAFIIVLVLLFHTVLYHSMSAPSYPAASIMLQPQFWKAYPVIDGQHSQIFSFIHSFIDSFAMSLMFFLSGLFVWNSLKRKGRMIFIRDRLIRLGIPLLMMILIIPLTFMPTYLETESSSGISGFFNEWLATGNYFYTGPGWFICLLLIFNIITLFIYKLLIKKKDMTNNKLVNTLMTRPGIYFLFMFIISLAVYLPMTLRFPEWHWFKLYPFEVQTSRIFLYFIFFLTGVLTGAYRIDQTILKSEGRLSRTWILWLALGIASFVLKWKINLETNMSSLLIRGSDSFSLLITGSIFVLCCVSCSFAFIALFMKFIKNHNRISDSLDKNSYGIFIIHYPLISWLQYSLLGTSLSPHIKGPVVFTSALILCWLLVATIRKIPGVAKVI
jgi:surface polysaccharide O-acyltransferase-like enzyme